MQLWMRVKQSGLMEMRGCFIIYTGCCRRDADADAVFERNEKVDKPPIANNIIHIRTMI